VLANLHHLAATPVLLGGASVSWEFQNSLAPDLDSTPSSV